jgi:hypothetical protein
MPIGWPRASRRGPSTSSLPRSPATPLVAAWSGTRGPVQNSDRVRSSGAGSRCCNGGIGAPRRSLLLCATSRRIAHRRPDERSGRTAGVESGRALRLLSLAQASVCGASGRTIERRPQQEREQHSPTRSHPCESGALGSSRSGRPCDAGVRRGIRNGLSGERPQGVHWRRLALNARSTFGAEV